MKEKIYIQATKQAWRFMWQNKIIWLFGIFAALLGQFGIMEFLGKIGMATGEVDKYFAMFKSTGAQLGFFAASASFPLAGKLFLFILLALLVGLVVFIIFIAIVSQGVIIYTSAQSIKKRKINVMKGWNLSAANFWRLFFINFLKKLIIIFLSIIVSFAAYGALIMPSVCNNLLFLLVFLLASATGIILSFLVVYAAAYVILEKYSVREAVIAAWNLFLRHWLVSIEVGLIVLVFNLLLAFLTTLGFVLFVLPPVLLWFVVALVGGGQMLFTAGFVAALIFFTMYLMLVGAAFTVFTTHIWTFIFMKMHKKGIKSRILHFLARKKKKK